MARQKRKQVEVNGILFDSTTESLFYKHLLENKDEMKIHKIELQKTFTLLEPYTIPCFICRGKGKVRGAKEGTQRNCSKCSGKGVRQRRGMIYTPDMIITYTDGSQDVIDVKGQGGFKNSNFSYYKKVFEYVHSIALIVVYWCPKKKQWIWD